MSDLRDSTFTIFLAATKPLEGVTTWMYPDDEQLVTTGIGDLIDPIELALPLPWFHLGSGVRATQDEVRVAWTAVQKSGLGKLGGFDPRIQALTDLRLLETDVDALVRTKADLFDSQLRAGIPGWDALPDAPQAGTLMIAWACGVEGETGVLHGWPHFLAALKARDFATCAKECQGRTLRPARNAAQASLFARAAAATSPTEPAPAAVA